MSDLLEELNAACRYNDRSQSQRIVVGAPSSVYLVLPFTFPLSRFFLFALLIGQGLSRIIAFTGELT